MSKKHSFSVLLTAVTADAFKGLCRMSGTTKWAKQPWELDSLLAKLQKYLN